MRSKLYLPISSALMFAGAGGMLPHLQSMPQSRILCYFQRISLHSKKMLIVFEREGHESELKMLVFTGHGNSAVRLLISDTQSFVDTEDVLHAMYKHVRENGLVENMFIEFENTKIPICHESELRIVAHMATAYYNACLAKTLSSEKDLSGNSYTPHTSPHTSPHTPRNLDNKLDSEDKFFFPETNKTQTQKNKNRNKKRLVQESNVSCEENTGVWDEEKQGDRLVYDASYQMNEDLVPWLMNPEEWQEKYGLY